MDTIIGFWAKDTVCSICRRPMIVNGYRCDLRPLCGSCAEDVRLREQRLRNDKENDAIRDAVVDSLKGQA